jgi:isoleucyl-tRNA synthetase
VGEEDVYNELLKKNSGKPLFNLHDGPPFSNGDLHMGHALNKRSRTSSPAPTPCGAIYTPYIPGWDNHGMPIESAIIKQNKLDRKSMSVPVPLRLPRFRQHYVDVQRDGFKRMGVIGDWDHPTRPWTPASRPRRSRCSARCSRRAISTRA